MDLGALRSQVRRIAAEHPAVGLGIGVVADHGFEFAGHGVADVGSGRPISAGTPFRVASISKVFTGVGVAQLWQRGLVDLDAPANQYLREFQLVPARRGLGTPTVRQLLTHTGGLGELAHASGALLPDFGESVPTGQDLPTLAQFYRGGPRVHAQPGTRFVYTNHGPAVLGQLVADVTGMPLARYLREHVFDPLGMASTCLRRGPQDGPELATGYEIGRRGLRVVAPREMVTAGAAAVVSTPADMARFMADLLRPGRGAILDAASARAMLAPQYQPDPRIPGMGLAFFRSSLGGLAVVGHQGSYPGFHSQMLLAPGAAMGVIAFSNGAHQADFWLPAAASEVLRRVLGLHQAPPPVVPQRPDLWPGLCGVYRLPARLLDTRLRGMLGAGIEVHMRSGQLRARFLTPIPMLARGFVLRGDDPADPRVLGIDLPGMGTMRLVFGGPGSDVLHLDLMPVTLHRRPAAGGARWRATGASRRRVPSATAAATPAGQGPDPAA
jgi:CubicO group peptidase (beta-lactamase class C family)